MKNKHKKEIKVEPQIRENEDREILKIVADVLPFYEDDIMVKKKPEEIVIICKNENDIQGEKIRTPPLVDDMPNADYNNGILTVTTELK